MSACSTPWASCCDACPSCVSPFALLRPSFPPPRVPVPFRSHRESRRRRRGVVYQLPVSFVYEHLFQCREEQTPFVRRASGFEDFVVRCVRFAFAHIPPRVGRVFFSRPVALPFLRFRMLRHGYLRWPIHWKQATDVGSHPRPRRRPPSACCPARPGTDVPSRADSKACG